MFFSEILKLVGLDGLAAASGYNIIDFNGESLYADGIKRILLLTQPKISLEFKGCIVHIEGDLRVERLEEDSIIVKGKISLIHKELRPGRNEKDRGKKERL